MRACDIRNSIINNEIYLERNQAYLVDLSLTGVLGDIIRRELGLSYAPEVIAYPS